MLLRSQLQQQACSFEAAVTADYGEEIYTFGMDCRIEKDGSMFFRVTAPESIAGITGTVDREKGELTFSDTVLAFEWMADDLLSPVSAPWVMMHTLLGGYISTCGNAAEGIRIHIDDTLEQTSLRTEIRTDGEDHPVCGEIFWEGRRILTVDVKNFRFV